MFENIFDKERELTSKEKDRLNNLDLINNKMYDKGYKKRELTISIKLANVMAAVIGIPICFMYGYCFYIYNGGIRYEYSLTKCILYLVLFCTNFCLDFIQFSVNKKFNNNIHNLTSCNYH